MTSPTRDSPRKRAHILDSAATLFADQGYEATTLAMVAHASGAAVGSIAHFFGDKVGLATAVYGHLVDDMVGVIEAALVAYGTDVAGAIRAAISSLFQWANVDQRRPRLIRVLAAAGPTPQQTNQDGLEIRVADILAKWARQANIHVLLAPMQLYALIGAPAMCGISCLSLPSARVGEDSVDWVEALTAAARAAIAPPVREADPPVVKIAARLRRRTATASSSTGNQRRLLD